MKDKIEAPPEIEVGPGLTKQLYYDGKMLVLHFKESMSRKVVDSFYDTYVDYINSQLPSMYRYVVYHFHKSHIAATPYLGKRVNDLNAAHPGEKGRIAMSLSNPPIRNILRFFVRRRQHQQPELEFGFFETPEESFEWVESYLLSKPEEKE